MNLYFLVEGEHTEKKVYSAWVPQVFSGLERVHRLEDLQGNHFFIFSAKGNPFPKDLLSETIKDVMKHGEIDQLFICIDAEEMESDSLRNDIERKINEATSKYRKNSLLNYSIIIQNRCMETWFLGNRRIMKRNPQTERLRLCQEHFSVLENDPEEMPIPEGFNGTQAACHIAYFKAMLAEHNLSYSKSNPGEVLKPSYLAELAKRSFATGHLPSLKNLLEIWKNLGGTIPQADPA